MPHIEKHTKARLHSMFFYQITLFNRMGWERQCRKQERAKGMGLCVAPRPAPRSAPQLRAGGGPESTLTPGRVSAAWSRCTSWARDRRGSRPRGWRHMCRVPEGPGCQGRKRPRKAKGRSTHTGPETRWPNSPRAWTGPLLRSV